MDDLEVEMDDISKEQVNFGFFEVFASFKFDLQRMLTDIVKNCMASFIESLKSTSNIEIEQDTANGYITRALSHHYEKNYFIITPSNVKPRMSEEELRNKL